ncbi:hypothetical protein QA635_38905 [Bradyrhizobium brasilense]|uniref:hypothetical protein n=1 Tax=Bradyrhizobium brasilense TaxID=1419277 RepID=UPI0024B0E054|nr:hypothetical protein [Bradyrhizobium australafricanum]WFU32384.1 hypothetical protein QA635_38905 [Bradyrhizobium australafricanum]
MSVRNFDFALFIAPSACLFEVVNSQEAIEAGLSEGSITVTRTTDGARRADRVSLPDYTAESGVIGLQRHCVWMGLLDDARRYFASTKLGVLEAEPHTVEPIFGASMATVKVILAAG